MASAFVKGPLIIRKSPAYAEMYVVSPASIARTQFLSGDFYSGMNVFFLFPLQAANVFYASHTLKRKKSGWRKRNPFSGGLSPFECSSEDVFYRLRSS